MRVSARFHFQPHQARQKGNCAVRAWATDSFLHFPVLDHRHILDRYRTALNISRTLAAIGPTRTTYSGPQLYFRRKRALLLSVRLSAAAATGRFSEKCRALTNVVNYFLLCMLNQCYDCMLRGFLMSFPFSYRR